MFEQFVLYSSLIYVLIFIFACIVSQITHFDVSNNVLILSLGLFTISCSIIAFYSTSSALVKDQWDLDRYYLEINKLRGKSFGYAMENGLYKNSIITNILFFIVSRTNNNAWLQFIATLFSLVIFSYILMQYKICKNYSFSTIGFYILLFFAIVKFSVVLLSVRWILAVSLCSLGVYFSQDKSRKGIIKEIICLAIAICIHYGIIYYIFIRFISIFKNKYFKLILLFSVPIIYFIGPIFNKLGYFAFLYDKLTIYLKTSFIDIRVEIVQVVTLFIYFIMNFLVKKESKKNNFTGNFLFGIIGVLPVYDLFARSIEMYTFVCQDELMDVIDNEKYYLFKPVLSVIIIGMLAYQIVFMKSQWRFII